MKEDVLPPEGDNDSNQKTGKQEEKNSKRIDTPKSFSIQEIENLSDDRVQEGGAIDLGKPLDPLERLEKSRMRRHITYSMLSLSIIWVLLGLIHFLLTGNSFLLATSSPMSIPVLIIIKYYFSKDYHLGGDP